MKKYLLAAALVTASTSAISGTTSVSGSGDSEYCYSDIQARRNADTEAYNKASEACQKMNGRIGSKFDNGSVNVKACGGGERGNYRITVTGAQFSCILR